MHRLQQVLSDLSARPASHALSIKISLHRPAEEIWVSNMVELAAPLHGAVIGASLHGVDLTQELTPAQAEWLAAALWEHGVLHVPGQKLGGGQLERLANYFGAPAPPPTFALEGGGQPLPQVLRSIDSSSNSAAGWHTDLNFEAVPCTVTMLHCQVAPERGGATHFASTAAVFVQHV
jgi:alpha-ketoglutarate-dependent taurine dioxygenase